MFAEAVLCVTATDGLVLLADHSELQRLRLQKEKTKEQLQAMEEKVKSHFLATQEE